MKFQLLSKNKTKRVLRKSENQNENEWKVGVVPSTPMLRVHNVASLPDEAEMNIHETKHSKCQLLRLTFNNLDCF